MTAEEERDEMRFFVADEEDDEKKSSYDEDNGLGEDKSEIIFQIEKEENAVQSQKLDAGGQPGSLSSVFRISDHYPHLLPGFPGKLGHLPLSPPPAHSGHPSNLLPYNLLHSAPFTFLPPWKAFPSLQMFPPYPGFGCSSFLPGPPAPSFPGLITSPTNYINGLDSPKSYFNGDTNAINYSPRNQFGMDGDGNLLRNPFLGPMSHNGLLTTDHHFKSAGGIQNPSQKLPKKPTIKKPLNAFMLFMKEMRQSVIDECTLKESAAINQILGRRWHELDRSQQAKYYEMAKKEKELHAQKYPGWSARDNYAMNSKKKKKRHDHLDGNVSSDSDSSRTNKLRHNSSNLWKTPNTVVSPIT